MKKHDKRNKEIFDACEEIKRNLKKITDDSISHEEKEKSFDNINDTLNKLNKYSLSSNKNVEKHRSTDKNGKIEVIKENKNSKKIEESSSIANEQKEQLVKDYQQDLNECPKDEKEEEKIFDKMEEERKYEESVFVKIWNAIKHPFIRMKEKRENKNGMKELSEINLLEDNGSRSYSSHLYDKKEDKK